MTREREDLIRELSGHCAVPGVATNVGRQALLWLGMASLIAVAAIVWRRPLRDAWLVQLLAEPREMLTIACGLLAALTACLAAFHSSVPSGTPPLRQARWALLLGAAWLTLLVIQAAAGEAPYDPVLKRSHCWFEVLAFGTPGLLLGLAAVGRLWPLHGAWSGALLGFAAGAIPAILMHFACIPQAAHSLAFHVGPALVLAIAGSVVGARVLRRS